MDTNKDMYTCHDPTLTPLSCFQCWSLTYQQIILSCSETLSPELLPVPRVTSQMRTTASLPIVTNCFLSTVLTSIKFVDSCSWYEHVPPSMSHRHTLFELAKYRVLPSGVIWKLSDRSFSFPVMLHWPLNRIHWSWPRSPHRSLTAIGKWGPSLWTRCNKNSKLILSGSMRFQAIFRFQITLIWDRLGFWLSPSKLTIVE